MSENPPRARVISLTLSIIICEVRSPRPVSVSPTETSQSRIWFSMRLSCTQPQAPVHRSSYAFISICGLKTIAESDHDCELRANETF